MTVLMKTIVDWTSLKMILENCLCIESKSQFAKWRSTQALMPNSKKLLCLALKLLLLSSYWSFHRRCLLLTIVLPSMLKCEPLHHKTLIIRRYEPFPCISCLLCWILLGSELVWLLMTLALGCGGRSVRVCG